MLCCLGHHKISNQGITAVIVTAAITPVYATVPPVHRIKLQVTPVHKVKLPMHQVLPMIQKEAQALLQQQSQVHSPR